MFRYVRLDDELYYVTSDGAVYRTVSKVWMRQNGDPATTATSELVTGPEARRVLEVLRQRERFAA